MTEPKPEDQYNVRESDDLILALDASTTAVGWCLAKGDFYIGSDIFKPKGKNPWRRIAMIDDWLRSVLDSYQPNTVVIEESCGDRGNRRTDRLLGAVLGVVFSCIQGRTTGFILVNPQSVKATGFCKDTPVETSLLIGKEVEKDEADAIGVWQAYLVKRKTAAGAGSAAAEDKRGVTLPP